MLWDGHEGAGGACRGAEGAQEVSDQGVFERRCEQREGEPIRSLGQERSLPFFLGRGNGVCGGLEAGLLCMFEQHH